MTHDQVLASDAESGVPLAELSVLGDDDDSNDVTVVLAPQLASEERLSEVRAVWVRAPGDDQDVREAMGRAESSIRRLVPQRGVQVSFAEVLVPSAPSDLHVPLPPSDWQQFVVEPRDRPHPEASDSFYDPATAPLQGLHAALIIGGILGGNNLDTPSPRVARNDLPWIVHPFSRVVSGGSGVRSQARQVLHDRLPHLSAADLDPERYLLPEPEDVSSVIDEAVDWLRSREGEALTFRRPSITLEVKGQSFGSFVRSVADFTVWALRGMFGPERWRDIYLGLRARFARSLEADDYGAVIDLGAPTPQGLHLRDWDGETLIARQAGDAAIAESSRADGDLVPPTVWNSLTALVASVIDGSSPPAGWVPRERFGRRYSLAQTWVVRPEGTESTALSLLEAGGVTLPQEIKGELSRVKYIGASELERSISHFADGLNDQLVMFSGPNSRVSRTAQEVIEQGTHDESSDRIAIAESIDHASTESHDDSLPLLSRLRARVLSDLLLARATDSILSGLSEPAIPRKLETMRGALRNATWLVLVVALVGGGALALLSHFTANVNALLTTFQVVFPRSTLDVMGLVVGVMVAALLPTLARLFYLFRAYNEIGSRSLEYTRARAAARIHALNELNRLRNAERVLSLWEQILSNIRAPMPDQLRDEPLSTELIPDALRVAEPDIDRDELECMVIEEAIEIGWFAAALDRVLKNSLKGEDLDLLWNDEGLAGGELTLARDLAVEGEIQKDWWRAWTADGVRKVTSRLNNDERGARIHGVSARNLKSISAFREEILRDLETEYRPGSDYEGRFDTRELPSRVVAQASPGSARYRTTSGLVSVDAALIMRRMTRLSGSSASGPVALGSDETTGLV